MSIRKVLVLISLCSFLSVINSESEAFLHEITQELNLTENSKDPDVNRSIEEEVLSKDYQLETHFSTTSDGFVLKLYRISGYKGKSNIGNSVVHLQHGLGVSSNIYKYIMFIILLIRILQIVGCLIVKN